MTNDTTEEFLQVAVPTLARLAVKSHIEIGETVCLNLISTKTYLLSYLRLHSFLISSNLNHDKNVENLFFVILYQ